jgi:spermidine/putrescine transport system substrate-binding protein
MIFWYRSLITLTIAFAGGIFWQVFYEKAQSTLPSKHLRSLELLVLENGLPVSILDQYRTTANAQINMNTYENFADLKKKIFLKHFDIVLFEGRHLPYLLQNNYLLPLNKTELENLKHISVDIQRSMPNSKLQFSIPISWGLDGFLYRKSKFKKLTSLNQLLEYKPKKLISLKNNPENLLQVIYSWKGTHELPENDVSDKWYKQIKKIVQHSDDPIQKDERIWAAQSSFLKAQKVKKSHSEFDFFIPDEGGLFWTHCLGIPKTSRNTKAAYHFMNFLTQKTSAVEIAMESTSSSTNTQVNDDPTLPEAYKPSFLRKLPLNKISKLKMPMEYDSWLAQTWLNQK